ncbi:MAG TPA: acyl-CoA thioesterase domain-containing protein, partial [Ilumatobacter sp.]|nr:acyl-CoA thioesterase domain-containing protein [Ilumatobacter sp.]
MTGAFDLATTVQRVESADGPARFDAEVAPGWDIVGNANGGYLLALAARAMADVAERPPLTVTAHYLAPCPAGPCHVDVTVIRSGRRLATLRAGLWQGDRQILEVLGT